MKKLAYILILQLSLFSNLAVAAYQELKISRLDDSKIDFYIDQPETATKSYPYILFLQGSECRTVFKRPGIPQEPSKQFGVGFLLVDKYGISKSNNNPDDEKNCTAEFKKGNTLDQRISDYLRVIQFLRSYDAKWNKELLIIGGSEGAMLAPIVASYIPESKKVVMLAGGIGWNMEEELNLSLVRSAKKVIAEIKVNPTSEKEWLGHTYKWWHSMLWVRPVNYAETLTIPLLMFHGTEDAASPVESARAAKARFDLLNKTNLEYRELQGLDHQFAEKDGTSHKFKILEQAIKWLMAP